MNDLDHHLADLLHRSATAVEVRPDLDALLGGAGPADDLRGELVVDLRRRPRDVRRLLAVAAVAVVAGLAVVAVAARPGDAPPVTAGPSSAPEAASGRFPVFGELPPSVTGPVVLVDEADGQGEEGGPPLEGVVVGRARPDGDVDDVALLQASTWAPAAADDATVEDLGGGYQLVLPGGGSSPARAPALVGDGAAVLASGGPGVVDLLRAAAGAGLRPAVDPGGTPRLGLGDLPDGYTVVSRPRSGPGEPGATTRLGGAPADEVSATTTGARDPLLEVARAGGSLARVEVGGAPGMLHEDDGGAAVAWTTPEGLGVLVRSTLPAEATLALARGVRLVDEATWRDAYPDRTIGDDGGDVLDPTAHPLVGRPAPVMPGHFTGPDVEGRTAVLGFARGGCPGCVDVHVTLVRLVDGEWDPQGSTTQDGGMIGAAGEDDLMAKLAVEPGELEEWSITELPTVVVVGPDGIVRSVFTTPVGLEALDAAVEEASRR